MKQASGIPYAVFLFIKHSKRAERQKLLKYYLFHVDKLMKITEFQSYVLHLILSEYGGVFSWFPVVFMDGTQSGDRVVRPTWAW